MKVVIAIDSFKGSLSTFESAAAASEGIVRVFPDAKITVSPLADGGEGTVEAIIHALDGQMRTVRVHDPLCREIEASYGIISKNKTAVIEMAAASGITLISDEERNPLYTSTYGVGEMIADAITSGCRNFIVGIGGSATNDGGAGMLSALGVRFLDKQGNDIPRGAIGLSELCAIITDGMLPELAECRFSVACDVKNPLCGELGCSAVYGPQKGATPQMIKDMDAWLDRYAELTRKINPLSDKDFEGSGAAGGLGFAFLSYLNSELRSGIDIVLEATELEKHVKDADIVITGEGRLDAQSCMGKAPVGVARLAKKHGVPVIAVAGCVMDSARECNAHGIDAFFPILPAPCSLDEAMNKENAAKNLRNTTEQIFRVLKLQGTGPAK